MAKKVSRKRQAAPDPVVSNTRMDDVFKRTITAVQTKLQKKGIIVGHNPVITVLPVPSFILRYLMQNEGLPLSCIYQTVGPQASYKSTIAAEIARWHRLCGGGGLLCEAETKPTPELRNSVMNWDLDALHIEDCESLEDWQAKVNWYTREYQKNLEKADGPGRTIPWCVIVDSLTGKASRKTLDNITDTGFAGLHFPIEAKSIADFMRAYPQKLLGWPFTFVGVNHMKIARSPDGQVDYNIPGGWALKFQCAMIFEMERVGSIKEFSTYKAATIKLNTIKNSYGPDGVRVRVRFKTWYQEDAPGVQRLHSRFEWWEASTLFLATCEGVSDAKAKILHPKLKEACDVREKAGGSAGKLYYSNRLGVSANDAMSAHDLGMLLETRTDVLSDLYEVTGIQRRPFFKPGVDFLKQMKEHEYQAAQAEAADEAIAKMQAVQDSMATAPEMQEVADE